MGIDEMVGKYKKNKVPYMLHNRMQYKITEMIDHTINVDATMCLCFLFSLAG